MVKKETGGGVTYSRLLMSIVAMKVSQMMTNSDRDTIRRDRNKYSVIRFIAMYLLPHTRSCTMGADTGVSMRVVIP
jgi:hypothetical protein